jgi:ABC-type multidrug transport system fused ATPase/permease subunit
VLSNEVPNNQAAIKSACPQHADPFESDKWKKFAFPRNYKQELAAALPSDRINQSADIHNALEELQPGIFQSSLRMLSLFAFKHPQDFCKRLTASVAVAGFGFATTWGMGRLVDSLNKASTTNTVTPELIYSGITLAGLYVSYQFSKLLEDYFSDKVGALASMQVEDVVSTSVAKYPVENLESEQFRTIVTKINNNQFSIIEFIQHNFALLGSGVGVGVASATIFSNYWQIGAAVGLATIPAIMVEKLFAKEKSQAETDIANTRRQYIWHNWFTTEPKFLKDLNLSQQVLKVKDRTLDFLRHINKRLIGIEKTQTKRRMAASLCLDIAVTGSTIFLIKETVFNPNLSLGSGVFLITTLLYFKNQVLEMSDLIGNQLKNLTFVQDALRLKDVGMVATTNNRAISNKRLDLSQGAPKIELKNVSFAYPDGKDIIQNLNLSIQTGGFVAITGKSGSGKTTLVNLIAGIYKPTSGQILVNGTDLEEIDPDQWKSIISLMSQGSYPYESFTLRQAIDLGIPLEGEPMDLKTALELSGADKIIAHLDAGIDTVMGNGFSKGQDFSSGQLQIISAARMFRRNPRLMLLDEPGSNLDIDKQLRLSETLAQYSEGGRTRIMISHNFAAVSAADRIIIMDAGKIVEDGTHEELMAKAGHYAKAFTLEKTRYDDD